MSPEDFDFRVGQALFYTRFMSFAEPLDTILNDIVLENKITFAIEVSPSGQTWPPLKRKRPGGGILDKTGRMKLSVTEVGAYDNFITISNNRLEFGTETPYAKPHQYGVPSRNLPQREFVGMTEERIDKYAEIVADAVADKIEEEFRRMSDG